MLFNATKNHLTPFTCYWSSGLWLKKFTVFANSVITCWRFGLSFLSIIAK